MAKTINVPFFRQQADGYCLPACAQMVLAHLGISRSQPMLGRQLGLIGDAGTPATNITKLNSSLLTVICEIGTIADIERSLAETVPVIVFVQAGELPHHAGEHFQHAIIVVGIDGQAIYMLDPAINAVPVSSPVGDFLLAWDEMYNRYATIKRRK